VSAGKPASPATPVALAVPRAAAGGRLDRFVAGALEVSRSEVQRWIADGRVTVAGAPRDASSTVREGDEVRVVPDAPQATAAEPDAAVRFDILHVDGDLVVVMKPPGLVVHPARGHESGTLVNGLLARGLFARDVLEADASQVREGSASAGAYARPGIVHRLDKGTSGVMVVARNARAREALKAQFQAHSIERAYEAVVVGAATSRTFSTMHGRHPRDRMRFTSRLGPGGQGKRAVTHVRVLAALRGATHVACTLETGRTHQIRVHLAESGTPVLGDPLYGRPPGDLELRALAERLGHQALHARVLGLVHPTSGERLRFEAPPPVDFVDVLAALGAR
jgi:23S rRNA pseudouridine1911/1915/1917 synthase